MRVLMLSLALAFSPAVFAQPMPVDPAKAMTGKEEASPGYPVTRRDDVIEDHFGVKVADPYRWLEADVRQDKDVRDWVEAQNRTTERYLDTLPGRAILRRRMARLFDYVRYSTPVKAGARYFYSFNSGLQAQSPLYVRDAMAGKQRLLVDPNLWAKDGAIALAEWRPSPDGRYLLYAVQEGGSDWRTLQLVDVDSGKLLEDRIDWVRYSDLSWDADGTGFFYSRFPAPTPDGVFQSVANGQAVYYHRIGTPQASDILVYRTPDRPELGHRAKVTDDGRWLVITSRQGTDERNEVMLVALTPGWPSRPIKLRIVVRGLTNEWRMVGSRGDMLWFITDKAAPRSRLVLLDAARPHRKPVELVAERPESLVGGSLVGDRIILAYLSHAQTVAELVELDGRRIGDVPMPGVGTAAGFAGKSGDPETFFSFSSFTAPSVIYRYDTMTGGIAIFARPDLAFDPDAFLTEQLFYPSKDGTQIPMFLIRRKDIADSHKAVPTLLYGYGGFNISLTPGFSPTRLAWLEQGGAVAIANLRGGGEYGKAWHDAGRLDNKQNAFDDFIAAGEFLKRSGYTGKDQLAVEGRSNGGLLVGAVVNQRPDLFAAALPAVGVMDMLRFDRFTAGRYWVDDYGHPDREADFHQLYAYSPYHNILGGRDYPAILVTTGDTDDRVVPGHSFKYVAALQGAAIGDKPHLIRVDTRAGHGSGKATDKLIDEYADMYAFVARWTGLVLTDPGKGK